MIDQPREYPEHRVIGAEEKRPDIIRKSINLGALVQAAEGIGALEKRNISDLQAFGMKRQHAAGHAATKNRHALAFPRRPFWAIPQAHLDRKSTRLNSSH